MYSIFLGTLLIILDYTSPYYERIRYAPKIQKKNKYTINCVKNNTDKIDLILIKYLHESTWFQY